MKRRTTTIGVVIACALFGASTVPALALTGSAKPVPAKRWVHAVCVDLRDLKRDVVRATNDFKQQNSDLKGAAASSDPAVRLAVRDAFASYLDEIAAIEGRLVDNLRHAGVPKVKDGAAIARVITDALGSQVDALGNSATQARSLPTDDTSTFKAGLQKILDKLQANLNGLQSALHAAKKRYSVAPLDRAEGSDSACAGLRF